MTLSQTLPRAVLILGLASMTAPTLSAYAADTPPEKTTGLAGADEAAAQVDLAPHNLAGAPADYNLRARAITIAPGGATNLHPHAGRPGIVRVLKGTVVEYRGSNSRTLKTGEFWTETADVIHWFRNPSPTETAEIWVVDIVPKKK